MGREPKVLNVEMNGGTTRVPYVVDATDSEVVVEVKIEDKGDSGGKTKVVRSVESLNKSTIVRWKGGRWKWWQN